VRLEVELGLGIELVVLDASGVFEPFDVGKLAPEMLKPPIIKARTPAPIRAPFAASFQ
jgi:hypothetical protein